MLNSNLMVPIHRSKFDEKFNSKDKQFIVGDDLTFLGDFLKSYTYNVTLTGYDWESTFNAMKKNVNLYDYIKDEFNGIEIMHYFRQKNDGEILILKDSEIKTMPKDTWVLYATRIGVMRHNLNEKFFNDKDAIFKSAIDESYKNRFLFKFGYDEISKFIIEYAKKPKVAQQLLLPRIKEDSFLWIQI
jgi:hypothetical protein